MLNNRLEGIAIELAAVGSGSSGETYRALMEERICALRGELDRDDVHAVLQRTATIKRVAATALKIKSDALRASDRQLKEDALFELQRDAASGCAESEAAIKTLVERGLIENDGDGKYRLKAAAS
jgi:hypothetical protein